MGNSRSKRASAAEEEVSAPGAVEAKGAAGESAEGAGGAPPEEPEEPAIISRVAGRTRYTVDHVRDLYARFQAVAQESPEHPDQITRAQFNAVLDDHDIDWRSDAFSKRLFTYFDQNNEGTINFAEFVRGLSVLSNSTPREKLKLSFDMYDLEGSGRIAKWEMKKWLTTLPSAPWKKKGQFFEVSLK